MTLIDIGANLSHPSFAHDLDAVLARAQAHGVMQMIVTGADAQGSRAALALALVHPGRLFATAGVHPHHASDFDADIEALLRELHAQPQVKAVGETGLDYFRLKGDLEWQRTRFRTHIRAARESGKPLIIHTREAAADTLRIMEEENAAETAGVMHCFTESWEVAEAALAMGFYISFSGIVTFKNAKQLKDVAQRVPLERILIETDSPYLAPVPHRGKLNQPAYVKHVAEEIAMLRGISLDEVGRSTTENFARLFKLEKFVQ